MLNESTVNELAECRVPSGPTQDQLAALIAEGHSVFELARYCHLSTRELHTTMQTASCSRLTALLVESASLHCGWHR